jgi:hypothetical protein
MCHGPEASFRSFLEEFVAITGLDRSASLNLRLQRERLSKDAGSLKRSEQFWCLSKPSFGIS